MKIVNKGWGREEILISNQEYCLKKLIFYKKDNYFSMHFHASKKESWYVESGEFQLTILDTKTAKPETHILRIGDDITINPLTPHQLKALEDNSIILEVSTMDSIEDNHRVSPGMSQNEK